MTILLPELEQYQKDVLNFYDANPKKKWIIVKSPRQVGKSCLLSVLLVYASMKEANSFSICISPVCSQSRKIYDDVVSLAEPLLAKQNGSALELKFINGSKIKFGSAEQGDSLRGYTTKHSGILCVDEAAFVKAAFFYDILVPITNVHHSDIFMFSTPKFKQGVYYDLYTKGENKQNKSIVSFDWTKYDLTKYLPEDLLELYKKQLPKLTFCSEYLAEFIDGDGAVFNDFKRCRGHYIPDVSKDLYLCVDWGTGSGQDYTVITPMQVNDNKICVCKQIAFNDKTPTGTVEYIVDYIKEKVNEGFRSINLIVEKNSIGAVYQSILVDSIDDFETKYNYNADYKKQIEINCSTFTTTNMTKKRGVEQLELLFEQKKIVLPDDDKLMVELSAFTAKINDNGTVLYSGQTGTHDDRVMSLLFGVYRLYNELE